MAWTTPRTWVAGEVVTAAIMNTHVRDNFNAIGDPWASWTPVWTATTTNPALNNGTAAGHYMQAGKLIHFKGTITAGSTTTFGAGNYVVSLPVAANLINNQRYGHFQVGYSDNSTGGDYPGFSLNTGTTLLLRALPTTAGTVVVTVTPTVPMTWAVSDGIEYAGTYEAA